MNELFFVFLWTIATLAIAVFSIYLGKKYSVAYPVAMMSMLMVLASVLANKFVLIGPFVVTGGILVYSATFLITDLLSELWGKREAKIAVWAGFYGSAFLIVSLWIVISWPSPIFAEEMASVFEQALSLTPRVAIASLITYLLSQHLDVWLFHFWKKITNGKHLWIRNNGSTLISQFVDTVVFVVIAFYGVIPLIPVIVGGYVVKVAIALIDTPFIYLVRYIAERIEPYKETK